MPATAASASLTMFQRYRQVAAVLVKYGLVDVVDALHLKKYLAFGARALPARARVDPSLSKATRLRMTLEELGPTFIKFGQALSVRGDVLPAELVAELGSLQERVAPLAPGVAEQVVEADLGAPIASLFTAFDPAPMAAASIAQVHRAWLPDGTAVAVKVRRPGIAALIASDVEILRQLARLVERYIPVAAAVGPVALVEEFARTIRAEQDFIREARNLERVARNFEGDDTVRIPRVHHERSCSSVLTMELLEGISVAAMMEAPVDPEHGRLIAARGAEAVLAQVLEHGLFHADPHPGNLLVLPGDVIGFLDFGQVGRLDAELRAQLVRVVRAIWLRDARLLATVALELGAAPPDADTLALQRDLAILIDTYGDRPLAELSMIEVLTDVVSTAARHRLRLPVDVMLLIKAVMTIEGVGRRLDPSFKIIACAAPMAQRIWAAEQQPKAIARRARRSAAETLARLQALPGYLEILARKARDGRLQLQFVHKNLDHFISEMDRSSNRLSFAIVIAAILIASSLIVLAGASASASGYPTLGLAGFVVAGLLGIGLAIGVVRSGRL